MERREKNLLAAALLFAREHLGALLLHLRRGG
jgi:hypothetical protein